MHRMKMTRMLRSGPDGAEIGDAYIHEPVEVLGVQGTWTQVRLIQAFGQPVGWVSSDAIETVADPIGPPEPIDRRLFTRECWWRAISFEVNPHYLIATADIRSGTRTGRFPTPVEEFGPFRLTSEEWSVQAQDIEPGFSLPTASLGNWTDHVLVFSANTARTMRALGTVEPDAITLFLNQLLGISTAQALGAATGVLPAAVDGPMLVTRFGSLLAPNGKVLFGTALRAHIDLTLATAFANTAQILKSVGIEVLDDPIKDGLSVENPAQRLPKSTLNAIDDQFNVKAPGIMARLITDFGFADFQAAGILGNIGHECNGFKWMEERGNAMGYGWCQWSKTRRRDFEQFCIELGVDKSDPVGNYGFLKHELRSSYYQVQIELKKTQTLESATRLFMKDFENPHKNFLHLDRRVDWAKKAASRYKAIMKNDGSVAPYP